MSHEYKAVHIHRVNFESELNCLGREGWEPIDFESTFNGSGYRLVVLKRSTRTATATDVSYRHDVPCAEGCGVSEFRCQSDRDAADSRAPCFERRLALAEDKHARCLLALQLWGADLALAVAREDWPTVRALVNDRPAWVLTGEAAARAVERVVERFARGET